MTFDSKLELLLPGFLPLNIMQDVRAPITIKRGRSNEGSKTGTTTCEFTLNNANGRYSPRNPLSDLYGLIGRNTQIRYSVRPTGTVPWLMLATSGNDTVTAPDTAGLSITGDLDVRFDIEPRSWNRVALTVMAKDDGTPNASWDVVVNADMTVTLFWTSNGSTYQTITSDVPIPGGATGRKAVRVTFDVNLGGTAKVVRYYHAPTLAGPWVQFDGISVGGVTSIFDSNSNVGIRALGDFTRWFGAEIRNGIDGPVVASPDFTAQAPGATSFVDAQGNTWTLNQGAEITDWTPRFVGEISEWPQKWDKGGADYYVPVEASGILRRLERWKDPLQSTLRRGLPSAPGLISYWPLEDAPGSQQFASALPGGSPMRVSGTPDYASYSNFPASSPIATAKDEAWVGRCGPSANTGVIQVRFLMHLPDSGIAGGTILRILCGGTAQKWEMAHQASAGLDSGTGGVKMRAWDADNNLIYDSGTLNWFVGWDGVDNYILVTLQQDGADVDWQIGQMRYVPGVINDLTVFHSGTKNAATIGAVKQVELSPNASADGTAFGHLTVQNQITSFFDDLDLIQAYQGETITNRFLRLCDENDIPRIRLGQSNLKMGPQLPDTILNLLQQCEDTDAGQLFEPRYMYGLGYRCRSTLERQDPKLELAYDEEDLAEFDPTEDDQSVKNDITVTRQFGSSARETLEEGPLSVQPPPDGVGRYTDSPEVSLSDDSDLTNHAAWRLALGTVDELRYPKIGVQLAQDNHLADAALTDAALWTDVGDRITVTGTPNQIPPEGASQIILGMDESVSSFLYSIDVNCAPESPYQIGMWAGDEDDPSITAVNRWDTEGSHLYTNPDAVTTTLVVASDWQQWTDDPGDLPYDIAFGGERATVTAVGNVFVDTFTRDTVNGWGSADTGQSYGNTGGVAANYLCTLGVGRVAHTDVGVRRFTFTGATFTDVDFAGQITNPPAPTGASIQAAYAARYVDSQNFYIFQLTYQVGGGCNVAILKRVANTFTSMASVNVTNAVPGARKWLRCQIKGNVLKVKTWDDGTPEPGAWSLGVLDSTFTIGAIGTHSALLGGNTNALPVNIHFDNITMTEPQKLTVVRSVNGVVKAHGANVPVSLADPVRWGLRI